MGTRWGGNTPGSYVRLLRELVPKPCETVFSYICSMSSPEAACGAAELQSFRQLQQQISFQYMQTGGLSPGNIRGKQTGGHRSQLSTQQKPRENHNSHSGPEKPPQILQTKTFCFFCPFAPLACPQTSGFEVVLAIVWWTWRFSEQQ